jgi:hypothetical protein
MHTKSADLIINYYDRLELKVALIKTVSSSGKFNYPEIIRVYVNFNIKKI